MFLPDRRVLWLPMILRTPRGIPTSRFSIFNAPELSGGIGILKKTMRSRGMSKGRKESFELQGKRKYITVLVYTTLKANNFPHAAVNADDLVKDLIATAIAEDRQANLAKEK